MNDFLILYSCSHLKKQELTNIYLKQFPAFDQPFTMLFIFQKIKFIKNNDEILLSREPPPHNEYNEHIKIKNFILYHQS